MRIFLLICLLLSANCYGQEMTTNVVGNTIAITLQGKKYCKYMYITDRNSSCHHVIYYTPVYSCTKKELTKQPRLNYKDELPVIRKMLDAAKDNLHLQLCLFEMKLTPYDDLMMQLIDIFANSEEWKEHMAFNKINRENPDWKYDARLVNKILDEHHFFSATDTLLRAYGFRVSTFHPAEAKQQLVPVSELIRLKKNKDLVIPLPDPIWLQLNLLK